MTNNTAVAEAPMVNESCEGGQQDLPSLFTTAQRLLAAKQGAEALLPLQEILRINPLHPDAYNLASVAFGQMGMLKEAESSSRQAIALKPEDAGFHLNLANRLNDQGRSEEAIATYEEALRLDPDHLQALKSYMSCMSVQGRWAGAQALIAQLYDSIERDPELLVDYADICANAGDRRKALELYQKAVERAPERKDWQLQIVRFASSLHMIPLAKETAECLLQEEEDAELRVMLASIMHRTRNLKAMAEQLDAIPEDSAQAANAANLRGMMLVSQVKLKEGLESMAKTKVLAPHAFTLHATRSMYLNYDPERSRVEVSREHLDVGQRFKNELPLLSQDYVDRRIDPERKLRIGFVSPDFRAHSVAYFARPFFDAFNRDRFDVVAYANVPKEDPVTADLKELVTDWRDIVGLHPQQVADEVRKDQIDILVDLAGFTKDTRLLAFTARPAPIQMTYIGYPNTTGLPQVDYRIVDGITDPDGIDDDYSETLIRLPGCFLCYAIPSHAPVVEPGPCEHRDHVTFGSFNNLAKINPAVLALWADVLNAVPRSRLLLKSTSSNDPVTQDTIRNILEKHGITPNRVSFADYRKTPASHLALYNDVDIALDTFPYNGTTTTCEALWMGVPVITLKGDRHAMRVGASLLSAIGFEACIAKSPEDYVNTAKLMAENKSILKTARRTLRETVFNSPLCDNKAHAQMLEEAFRATWNIWCEQRSSKN